MVIATWVSAVATIGLLIAAVVAGLQARALFVQERDERLERSQASKVAAWTATRTKAGSDLFGLCIQNASELPVTNLQIWTSHRSRPSELGPQRYRSLPPGFYFAPTASQDFDSESNRPRGLGSFGRPIRVELDDPEIWPTLMKPDSAQVTRYSFVDATGTGWQRKWAQNLERIDHARQEQLN
jgi:hypothetical protein